MAPVMGPKRGAIVTGVGSEGKSQFRSANDQTTGASVPSTRTAGNHGARKGARPSGKTQMSRNVAMPARATAIPGTHAIHRVRGESGGCVASRWNV